MAKKFDALDDDHRRFIAAQHCFFVATAPSAGGHVNLSPKGMDTFRVLGPDRVAYLDLTGSGNETAAHLLDDGRITFLFCAFEGKPLILRLYGRGRLVAKGTEAWDAMSGEFPDLPGARQIIVADLDLVQTSCGFGIPFYTYEGPRDTLLRLAEQKGDDGLEAYQREKNAYSLDGLPTTFAEEPVATG